MSESANPPSRSKEQPREFNPRWNGYLYILVASLVNFASISNLDIEEKPQFHGMYQVSIVFGAASFIISAAVLVLDRFQSCCDSQTASKFNFAKAMDGKIEGYTLAALTIWWVFGYVFFEKPGAIIAQYSGGSLTLIRFVISEWHISHRWMVSHTLRQTSTSVPG